MIINAKQPCLQRKTVSRQTGLLHFLIYAVGFEGIAVGFFQIAVVFEGIAVDIKESSETIPKVV